MINSIATGANHHPAYSLQDIFDTLSSSLRFEEVLDKILEVTLRELAADQGSLLLLQGSENPALRMLASRGLPKEICQRGYIPRKGSISEYVLRERRPIIINEVPRNDNFETMSADTSTPRTIFSAICVPLVARGSVLGTMNLNRTRNRQVFVEADLEACSIIASQAAIVIEHRRLQEELLQKERLAAIGQTVAGISHCIKNILSGVRGGLGLTEMGLNSDRIELVRDGFDMLKRNANVLSNLVLDLLDYSKEREPVRDTFSVSDVIHNVVSTVEPKLSKANIEVCTDQVRDVLYFGDHDQIFRALLNIVSNAVEACSDFKRYGSNPRVDIRVVEITGAELGKVQPGCEKQSNWLVLEVEDNGPGIPEERQPLIWDLFYSTKGSKGTGIGLAATKKMIEEHGGHILLETNAEWGSRFSVCLPVVEPPPRPARRMPAQSNPV